MSDQGLRDGLRRLIAEWREDAQDELRERGPGWVGAEAKLVSCADELDAVLASSPKADGWQPIETAPKDGTSILVAIPEYGKGPGHVVRVLGCFNGAWATDKEEAEDIDTMYFEPRFWQPLPAPPVLSTPEPEKENK